MARCTTQVRNINPDGKIRCFQCCPMHTNQHPATLINQLMPAVLFVSSPTVILAGNASSARVRTDFGRGKDCGHIAVEEQSLPSSVMRRTRALWANGRELLGAKQRSSWAQHGPLLQSCLSSHGNAVCLLSPGTGMGMGIGMGMGMGSEGPAPASSASPQPVQYAQAHWMGARGSE